MISIRCILPLLAFGTATLEGQESGADPGPARRYLAEADSVARLDGGRLWGRSLQGPLMFVDRGSRAVVANMADEGGHLAPSGSVYVGSLPNDQNLANTAFEWAGRRWTMVLLPLPEDPRFRAALVMHELWHRIQDSLGFPGASPTNDHLSSRDGRLWLRLEGRALEQALRATADRRRVAATDAVMFRRYRRSLIPAADSSERALELNEGLADYTGYTLAGLADSDFARHVATLDTVPNLGRSFAYYTGPAWGRLLDWTSSSWRRSLKAGDDLGEFLARATKAGTGVPSEAAVVKSAERYGYHEVLAEEDARAVARTARQAELRGRFVTGPVLRLPLRDMKVAFDPDHVEPLDSVGPVYATLRIVDRWGVLEVSSGGGLIRDWREAVVPAPTITEGTRIAGPGWTLELASGWHLSAGPREGDFTLK